MEEVVAELLGPALTVYNNETFSEQDFQNITNTGDSGKRTHDFTTYLAYYLLYYLLDFRISRTLVTQVSVHMTLLPTLLTTYFTTYLTSEYHEHW